MTRESYTRVLEYVMGTLNLTEFPRLLTAERYTFSPKGHAADNIAQAHSDLVADQLKIEDMELWP